jgi:hypothetical protein
MVTFARHIWLSRFAVAGWLFQCSLAASVFVVKLVFAFSFPKKSAHFPCRREGGGWSLLVMLRAGAFPFLLVERWASRLRILKKLREREDGPMRELSFLLKVSL